MFCPTAFILKWGLKVPLPGQLGNAAKGAALIRNIQAMRFCVMEFAATASQVLVVGSKHVLQRAVLFVTSQLLGEYPLLLEICYHSGLVLEGFFL